VHESPATRTISGVPKADEAIVAAADEVIARGVELDACDWLRVTF
jgi:hypothetical protein